jgi:uncharacterized phiE125 gp8 family phage protein
VSTIFREINSSLRPSGSAAEWPITLQDAKDVLDFGTTTAEDDRRIMALIPAAIAAVETDAQRAIANQTWILRMDEFPCDEIELRKPPVNAVSSVVYLDTDGTSTTLSVDDYQVDLVSAPARISPAVGSSGWPSTYCALNAVTVTFTAGYVETPIPALAIHAIKLALKAIYRECEPGPGYWGMIDRIRWEGGL